ncbi:tripartite tricarboxylate transporter substrate binding protein [Roseomonas terrae]|jgi:tripartite-type tricarboxylate transporter receptor subunit TctC|uniref:Tripartite tricarboxylate transporter substrate binding protein n=1 Tax=Neoroseomonas terrae TaxID=424799 RepID=A0ABS5EPT4_9PROT|nr:tripartite tricarboxylate transporter substrate binding protein [Neoroseomonas terrae]MBR0653038.1 tripartite tricarboxylate transporter substrate binding protein [Neoroseomonas terrae]
MKITRRAATAMILAPGLASAQQQWAPGRPVTFLGPYAAGGSFDVTQRAMGRASEPMIGQPIAILNRPGGAGTIMLNELARARPDGLTIGLLSVNTNAVAPQLVTMTLDPVADFTPLMTYGSFLTFVVVANTAPFSGLRDLIAYARREPGKLTVGVAAIGANSHLNMARLFAEEGVDVTFVPFTGGAPANTALLGGHIQCAVVSGEVLPTVRDGSLRILAILNADKSEEFPAVPTLPELGYSWSAKPWIGFGGPRGLPEAVASRWTEVLLAAGDSREVREVMRQLAFVPLRTQGDEMRRLMAESLAEHETVARAIRIGRFAGQ